MADAVPGEVVRRHAHNPGLRGASRFADEVPRTLKTGAADTVYPALIRALSHPLRARLLGVLRNRQASPRVLAGELGAPLATVSYHVRVLAELKLIRLVKTTPRRGAIEHHYEASARAERISRELWGERPVIAKQALVSAALGDIGRAATSAASQGGFDRADGHLTRTGLRLDERGFRELADELDETLERAGRIEEESHRRLARSDHAGELRAVVVIMLF